MISFKSEGKALLIIAELLFEPSCFTFLPCHSEQHVFCSAFWIDVLLVELICMFAKF